MRTPCIDALREWDLPRVEHSLLEILSDQDATVRLAAVTAARQVQNRNPDLAAALRPLLDDPDSEVRAEAALLDEEAGPDTLLTMLSSEAPEDVVSALSRLTLDTASAAFAKLHHDDPRIRAAVLRCLSRLTGPGHSPLSLQDLLDALKDPDPHVREAAVTALAMGEHDSAVSALSSALDDPARIVRTAASNGLAHMGEAGSLAAVGQMTHPRMWTADAALRALAQSSDATVRPALLRAYRSCVEEAWQIQGAIAVIPEEQSLQSRFLNSALRNASTISEWRLFEMLKILEDGTVVRSVQQTLQRGSNRDRADALEVLSNLADRETSDQFALLLEAGSFDEKLNSKAEFLDPPRTIQQVLDQALHSKDRWLRMASKQYGARYHPEQYSSESASEVEIMQRLLALRKVPLFTGLSLDRLEVIHKIMNEAEYLAGECLVREGDPGNELFVLLEGELKIYKGYGTPDQRLLSTLVPVGYMGEIAILDDSVRSATAIASMDSRLLTLAGDPFKELVMQTPEISFEIFKVLTTRIRAAEGR